MRVLFFSLIAMLALASCKKVVSTTDDIHFGEVISEEGAQSFDAVMTQLTTRDSFETKVVGTIQKVCKKKGCWVTLNDAGSSHDNMFVRFKDYGFFLPLDCDGRKVAMEGYAFKEMTSVEELRHYAEDEGKTEEEIAAIAEPKVEFKFMASGVKMLN
ncbi:MAG: DUF4920 domain-containing protein [Bacteroidia bacterium]|nr:DUF4920 domain-containing protein [Bacteroidia bacterium]